MRKTRRRIKGRTPPPGGGAPGRRNQPGQLAAGMQTGSRSAAAEERRDRALKIIIFQEEQT